jgi:hypothetical protein
MSVHLVCLPCLKLETSYYCLLSHCSVKRSGSVMLIWKGNVSIQLSLNFRKFNKKLRIISRSVNMPGAFALLLSLYFKHTNIYKRSQNASILNVTLHVHITYCKVHSYISNIWSHSTYRKCQHTINRDFTVLRLDLWVLLRRWLTLGTRHSVSQIYVPLKMICCHKCA